MSETFQTSIRPIFEVKTDLDPFFLYGSIQDTSILEDPSDPRLRLATLKAREKLEKELLFKKVDIEKESKNVVEPKIPSNNENKVIKATRTIKSENVEKWLSQIESTFSNIL